MLVVNDSTVNLEEIQEKLDKAAENFKQETASPNTTNVAVPLPTSGVCPHCGYCPHCGRPGGYYQRYYPRSVPYWNEVPTTTGPVYTCNNDHQSYL